MITLAFAHSARIIVSEGIGASIARSILIVLSWLLPSYKANSPPNASSARQQSGGLDDEILFTTAGVHAHFRNRR